MKKIFGAFLGLMLLFSFALCAFAGSCETYSGNNINAQNYSVWATTVKSHLHFCDDGRLMRVQYLAGENKILVEYYDDRYNRQSQELITMDYSVYGGFYAVGDTYFVLTGQNNPSESSSVTSFAITKYDKNWNRIASAQLKDCNTTIPFEAGSARFCHSGNYLVIRTSHEMYRADDGLNHQANVTIQLDMNSMKITDSFTDVMNSNYGYVSHSFNQFIKIDSDKIVAVDHGDAYPRSIVLTKYKTSVSSGKFTPSYYQPCTTVDLLKISGSLGANRTDCSVGGFEITSSGYLASLNSVVQGSSSSVRNIYLSYCDKDSSSAQLKQITNYSASGVSTPHLVKINENRFIVLWYFDGKVYYCETDGRGNRNSDILSFEATLSDCQPVVYNDKLVWYSWKNNETVFYAISLSDLSKTQKHISVSGHDYSPSSVSDTTVTLKCSKCSRTTTGKIPSSFELWWEDLSFSGGGMTYYNSIAEKSYHPGITVGLMVRYSSADLNDYEVVSDNESVAKITVKYDEFAVTAIKEGTAKITVRSKYNHDINKTYTFKVAHNWQVEENIEATCDKDGKTVKICSVCDESDTQTVKAKGHKMSEFKTVTEATCKSEGKKKSTCSVCGYYETTAIAKKDHDKKVSVEAVAPTCTKSGKTEGKKCSGCGTVVVAQQTVNALGHDLGEYKITKKPTCKAMGEETAQCIRCTYTKTRDVERAPHTEVTVKAIAPTCTKSGKTAGKKCSVCDKVTVEPESVSALGHELGDYEITKKPTCKAMGEETAQCIRCTYTKTRDVERAAHKEVTVKAVAPTCTKSGKTAGKKCSVCDKVTVEPESISALGHELGDYEITKKPTCKAMGEETAQCIRCTYTKTRDVERAPHKEVTVKAVAPTCTKSGKTAGKKCSVCDKVIVESESITALGHELGEYEITKEATCSTKGVKTAKCTRCSYSKTADISKLEHKEVTLKAVKATCTKSGKTAGKKCSLCGKVTVAQKSTDALGHSKKTKVITKATTKANGKISTVCETCGKDYGETRVYRIQSVTLSSVKYAYDGKTKTPKVTVTDYNKDQLVKDKDYTVTYQKGRKNPGKYSVTVKFKGNYSGTKTLYFEIKVSKVDKLTATAGTSAVNLKWSEVKGADGYQIYYSTSKAGKYKKLKSTSKLSYKKTGLKSGKTYYFKVRAYKKMDSGTVFGSFSSVKSAKIK